jgi:hypothetical protein
VLLVEIAPALLFLTVPVDMILAPYWEEPCIIPHVRKAALPEIMPNSSSIRMGRTRANSTAATPRRHCANTRTHRRGGNRATDGSTG